jgi:hypothetical protein
MAHMRNELQSRPLRTARYLLAFTEDEKRQLDQRCREMSAHHGRRVTLADVLRAGAAMYLDDLAADDDDALARLP